MTIPKKTKKSHEATVSRITNEGDETMKTTTKSHLTNANASAALGRANRSALGKPAEKVTHAKACVRRARAHPGCTAWLVRVRATRRRVGAVAALQAARPRDQQRSVRTGRLGMCRLFERDDLR